MSSQKIAVHRGGGWQVTQLSSLLAKLYTEITLFTTSPIASTWLDSFKIAPNPPWSNMILSQMQPLLRGLPLSKLSHDRRHSIHWVLGTLMGGANFISIPMFPVIPSSLLYQVPRSNLASKSEPLAMMMTHRSIVGDWPIGTNTSQLFWV